MVSQGAQLVFATSDDMRDGILAAAAAHPEVPMIWSSGDSAWEEGQDYRPELTNLGNVMGRMEYGKMIAGCAAALSTQTGQIGYLGPLINDETQPSGQLGLPRCPPLLGERRERPRRPQLHRQLDRVLVQHPRADARPDPGDQRVLRLRGRRGDQRDRHHRGAGSGRDSGSPQMRRFGPSPTTSRAPARKRQRHASESPTSTGALPISRSPSRWWTGLSKPDSSGTAPTGPTSTTRRHRPWGGSTARVSPPRPPPRSMRSSQSLG